LSLVDEIIFRCKFLNGICPRCGKPMGNNCEKSSQVKGVKICCHCSFDEAVNDFKDECSIRLYDWYVLKNK